MFDVRVMAYKAQNGMPLEGSRISVIVQRQIASDVSGVGFSLNPLNNCYDEVVIDASFGLGEAIVSGIVTPDHYVVEKVTMEILEDTVSDKKIALHLKSDGGIEQHDNPDPHARARASGDARWRRVRAPDCRPRLFGRVSGRLRRLPGSLR